MEQDKVNKVYSEEEQAKRRERILMRQKLLKDDCYRKYDRLTRSTKAHDYIFNYDKITPKRIKHPQQSSQNGAVRAVNDYASEGDKQNSSPVVQSLNLSSNDSEINETNNVLNNENNNSVELPFKQLSDLDDYLLQLAEDSQQASSEQMPLADLEQDNISADPSTDDYFTEDELFEPVKEPQSSEVLPWILSFLILGLLMLQAALAGILYISKNINTNEIVFYASCSTLVLSMLMIMHVLKQKSRIFIYLGLVLTAISYIAFTAFSILRFLNLL